MLTAKFDHFRTQGELGADGSENPGAGFFYKTVPHITLKSIAQNTNLDPVFAKHEPILADRLSALNAALTTYVTDAVHQKLVAKLEAKVRAEGIRAVTKADCRRWLLPGVKPTHITEKKAAKLRERIPPQAEWHAWKVPFDTGLDWPQPLQDALTAYRTAWRAKMDEVNTCIQANADPEKLVDQPEIVKGVVRVSGPFTVEAVIPPEISLDEQSPPEREGFDGAPEMLEDTFEAGSITAHNAEAYLDQMLRLLHKDGVRFPDNKQMCFVWLKPLTNESGALHAEGRWVLTAETDTDPEGPPTVAVAFGPQYGPVTAQQVEELIRTAYRRGYDDLVIAGFSFDGPAQVTIEQAKHPRLRIHMAHIRPDVNPAMQGLLKEQPGSQLFSVFGQPRTCLEGPDKDGLYRVIMEGVDIYNPVDNSITPSRADKVAAWFLDSDYDGRTFCITQAFFPDRDAWSKLAKALKSIADEDAFAAFSGTESLPFPVGQYRTVAVKVIDPRGNEVMRLHRLERRHG